MSSQSLDSLFTPVEIGKIALKHRIVMPAMSRLRAHWPSGDATNLMRNFYAQRASDGGLIIAEASAVAGEGRSYHTGPGLFSDSNVEAWKRVTDAVHAKGGVIFAQLTHAGRATSVAITHVTPVTASIDLQFPSNPSIVVSAPTGLVPPTPHRALETTEVQDIVDQFRAAAQRAKQAGFDGIEILAANGHLVEQFLHDSSNKRTDHYGGTTENRTRFLMEIFRAVSEVWSSQHVGVRVSPSSTFNGMGDSNPRSLYRDLTQQLNDLNPAYLHVIEPRISGADTVAPGEEPVAAPRLARIFKGPVIAAGGFEPRSAAAAISQGDVALISFGRHFTSNPDLPRRIARGYPLTPYDRSTFYAFDARGYTDFRDYDADQPLERSTG